MHADATRCNVCTKKEFRFVSSTTLYLPSDTARPPFAENNVSASSLALYKAQPRLLRFPLEILVIILLVKAVLNVANIST